MNPTENGCIVRLKIGMNIIIIIIIVVSAYARCYPPPRELALNQVQPGGGAHQGILKRVYIADNTAHRHDQGLPASSSLHHWEIFS